MYKFFILLLSLGFFSASLVAQESKPLYSMIIKGGHVIDPKNNINGPMDIAIQDGKIAAVGRNLDSKQASQVVNASGNYVTPGLIDIHGHNFFGTEPDHYLSNGLVALPPDGFTFRVGVTTIVDCGGAGWKSFPTFKKNIIDNSQTRVLSFLNIVGEGMRGGAYEQDLNDMDPKLAASVARRYKDHIVGFKLAHYNGHEWTPLERVVQAGKLAQMPVIIDFGGADPTLSIEELFLTRLRPGDIFTHTFTELPGRESIVDPATKQLKPFVKQAQSRGVIFDVGFGGSSFAYSQAIPATKAGFFPNTISTDLHTGSMNAAMKDMLNVMGFFIAMGMDVPSVIKASTWAPAQAIKREELGHLSVGAVADIAVLKMVKGKFGFWDRTGYKLENDKKLQCEVTVRQGRVVYDLNGSTSLNPAATNLKETATR